MRTISCSGTGHGKGLLDNTKIATCDSIKIPKVLATRKVFKFGRIERLNFSRKEDLLLSKAMRIERSRVQISVPARVLGSQIIVPFLLNPSILSLLCLKLHR